MNFMKEPQEDGLYWLFGYEYFNDEPKGASVVYVNTFEWESKDGSKVEVVDRVVYMLGHDDSIQLAEVQKNPNVYWYGPLVPPER